MSHGLPMTLILFKRKNVVTQKEKKKNNSSFLIIETPEYQNYSGHTIRISSTYWKNIQLTAKWTHN